MARIIIATAIHVRITYLSPLYAYTPMAFPWVFMRSTALNCTTVTIVDAVRSDREDRDDSTKLPMRPSCELWKRITLWKRTRSAVRIPRPAVMIPTA